MDMKALLKRLVETESPSSDKAAVDRVGAIVADEARRLGAALEIAPVKDAGDHLIARWGRGAGGILLLCHMDTVFPLGTLEKMPYHESDGKIYGPGVLDMKSGIVIALEAVERLQTRGGLARRVTLLCTSDEEVGSLTSEQLIVKLAKEAELVLVLESALSDGSLKTWRKGVGEFWVKVKGRAAHAGGNHAEGRNAIEEMAHQVLAIQKMTDYEKGTTLNVGVIQGGTVSNVVPEEAVAQVDVRVMQPGEWERVESEMRALKPVLDGTSLEITGGLNRPPMPFDQTMKTTFEKIQAIGAEIGLDLKAGGSGGGSDGNFVAPLGIPVMDGLGAIGEGLHSGREFIDADSLEERAGLLAAIIEKWQA
ncbi:MAG: M20 family metallopeptidase [Anaerolineales bacterium]